MSARWKRNTVVATMAVLVCAAVVLNWKYSGEEAVSGIQEAGSKILGVNNEAAQLQVPLHYGQVPGNCQLTQTAKLYTLTSSLS